MEISDASPEKLPGRTLISERRIRKRIRELASEITTHYGSSPFTVIGLMHGSIFFFADLIRLLPPTLEIECWNVSSYIGKKSSGNIKGLEAHKKNYQKQPILLIDDIFDTGITLERVTQHLSTLNPGSIHTCVLLEKEVPRSVSLTPDWVGFKIPDRFVIGYGLDLDQSWRPLPMIRTLD